METTTIDGITQYLVELRIQGCGEVTCRRIAERFGEDTFDVCLSEWERLTEVEGIGQRKALAMHEAIQRKHGDELTRKERRKNERQREQTMFFGSIGVHGWTLMRILSKYGDEAMDVVKGDPYRLTELDGFGFARADKIAEGLGITGSDPCPPRVHHRRHPPRHASGRAELAHDPEKYKTQTTINGIRNYDSTINDPRRGLSRTGARQGQPDGMVAPPTAGTAETGNESPLAAAEAVV